MQDGGKTSARTPIEVSNPNDPRLRAYNDSNNLYKAYQFQYNNIPDKHPDILKKGTKYGNSKDFDYNKTPKQFDYDTAIKQSKEFNDWVNNTPDWYEKIKNKTAPKNILNIPDVYDFKNKEDMQKYEENNPILPNKDNSSYKVAKYYESLKFNEPVKIQYHNSPDIVHRTIKPTGSYYDGMASSPVYKKPVQPVIYQKPVVKQPEFKKQKGDIILTSTSDPRINDPSYYAVADGVLRKKPVKPVAVQPKPQPQQQIIDTPIQVTIAQPPAYTSQKQMYQGRAFMDSTKLRPGLYHPEEIEERMKNPNKKFPDGGKIYNPNNANSDLNFLNWYKNNTIEGKRGVPYSNELDYDYFSFYKNKGVGNINNHFPDTYKLPNHETFSNESLYAGNGAKGYWDKNKFIKYQDGGQIMKEKTLPEYKKGGMIKRADGSYSKRGLWDNIRENKGSGKKPTKEMLKQERKIKAKMEEGGVIDNPGFNALPKEVQENIIANMAMGGYIYSDGGTIKRSLNKYNNGGYTLSSTQGQLNKFNGSGGQSSVVGGQNDAGSGSSGSMNMAGAVQLGSMAGNALLGLIPDKTMTDSEGNVLGSYETQGEAIGKGALSGASAGAALGPWGAAGGALIGGTMGFINQRKDARQLAEAQSNINQNISSQKRLGGFNTNFNTMQTTNDNMYAHGGIVDTDQPGAIAELELQEQMQLPNGNVMGVDGPSHEQGGIEVNVPEGTRVFSDRLKLGNKTFAKHAKSLNNKIAKLDKKPDATAKQNTEMLINKQLDGLFNTQEEMKAVKEQTKQRKLFAKGGTIPPSHNGMYPAHNVTIMRHGGLTHYQDAGVVGPYDPSQHVRGNKPFMSYSSGYDYDYMTDPNIPKGSNFTAQQKRMDADQYQRDADMLNKTGVSPQNMAFAAAGLNNIIQNQQINKVNRPRTISNVAFTPGNRPSYVNYSAERAAIDSEATGARRGVQLGSGSYSTQAANMQAIRNQQMMGKGRSFQTQENANRTLDNAYNDKQAAAYNQGVTTNLGIDQYNLENQYNFDLWKQGNKMKATGAMGDTVTNLFNNQTSYNNQMKYWDVMKNAYSKNEGTGPSIVTQTGMPTKNKNGGVIRKLKK